MGGPLVRFLVVVGAPCSCAATTCSAPREEHPCAAVWRRSHRVDPQSIQAR